METHGEAHARAVVAKQDGEIAALKASLEEARAAEAKAREGWEHHRRLAETLITERDEARHERDRLKADLAALGVELKLAANIHARRTASVVTERERAEKAEREAAKANEDRALAIERLRTRDRERDEARVELDRARAVSEELRRQLEDLRADHRWTAADAFRARLRRAEALSSTRLRRWEEALAEVERLREELARRPLNPIDLDALRGRMGHVCDVWKPAVDDRPDGKWVCETCGKPFESWVEPVAGEPETVP